MDELDNGDNGPVTLGVTWFLCAFSGVFLALRFYAKISRHSRLWWDDYIIALAWVRNLHYHSPQSGTIDRTDGLYRYSSSSNLL